MSSYNLVSSPIQIPYVDRVAVKAKKTTFFKQDTVKVAEYAWGYFGKVLGLTRLTLNISLKTVHRLTSTLRKQELKVLTAINGLKLFGVIGIFLNLNSIYNTAQKALKSFQIKDQEGIAWVASSLSILVLDTYSEITTFINAFLSLVASPIAILSTISNPIGFVLSGMILSSKTAQIIKTDQAFREFKRVSQGVLQKRTLSQEDCQKLLTYLESKLDLVEKERNQFANSSSEVQQENIENAIKRKRAALQRYATEEVVNEFDKIFETLKNPELSSDQVESILTGIEKVNSEFKKTINFNCGMLVSYFGTLAGLILILVSVHPAIPLILFAASILLRIACLIYQDLSKD